METLGPFKRTYIYIYRVVKGLHRVYIGITEKKMETTI